MTAEILKLEDILTTELHAKVLAVTEQEFTSYSKTITQIVKDAYQMLFVAEQNLERLNECTTEAPAIDEALALTKALDFVQSERERTATIPSDFTSEWQTVKSETDLFTKRMLTRLRYAFRKYPELLKQLSDIAKGNTIDDAMHDLTRLASLIENNLELVAAVKLPAESAPKCREYNDKLVDLSNKINYDKRMSDTTVFRRNQVLTIAREYLYEVRDLGKCVFSEEPELLSYFTFSF